MAECVVPPLADAAASRVAAAARALAAASPAGAIWHVFSNAGFLLSGAVLAADSRAAGAVRGAIFDSCPARVDPSMAARGVVAALAREEAADVETRRPVAVNAAGRALGAYLRAPPVASRLARAWAAWEALPPAPALFAYTDTDALIPPAAVLEFAAGWEARGGTAATRVFASPHCAHLRAHPTAYTAMAADFAARIEGEARAKGRL